MPKEDLFESNSSGRCPHCREIVTFDTPNYISKGRNSYSTEMKTASGGDEIFVYSSKCPNRKCGKPIVTARIKIGEREVFRLVHPFNVVRLVPPAVPTDIGDDFREAAAVLSTSEKASAALSRRCLQNLLTQQGYKQRDLVKQISAALKDLPRRIAENLDAIRVIGNYAAHPTKHKHTGMIADVEPEEASWTLDVLEDLFEHYYVQPKIAEKKRKKLDAKLKSLGKPPLKKP